MAPALQDAPSTRGAETTPFIPELRLATSGPTRTVAPAAQSDPEFYPEKQEAALREKDKYLDGKRLPETSSPPLLPPHSDTQRRRRLQRRLRAFSVSLPPSSIICPFNGHKSTKCLPKPAALVLRAMSRVIHCQRARPCLCRYSAVFPFHGPWVTLSINRTSKRDRSLTMRMEESPIMSNSTPFLCR